MNGYSVTNTNNGRMTNMHNNSSAYQPVESNMVMARNAIPTSTELVTQEVTPQFLQQAHINTSTVTTTTGSNPYNEPETMTNTDFLPAYLKQNVGRWVRVDFFIGNSLEQRVGLLLDVGASYIILKAIEPETIVVCDMFSIKFVTIIFGNDVEKLLT